MQSNYISPLRQAEIEKLRKKLCCSHDVAREALSLRRHIPVFAEEYILNKDLEGGDERFPLWEEYLSLVEGRAY